MVERLRIDHLGHRADGVVLGGSEPVYVPFALPGEMVEAAPVPGHPDRRHLLRVDAPSAERVAPFCPHFGICGGCALQHLAIEPYRAWKRGLVVEALRLARIEAEVGELIDAHGAGRRRITVHARQGTKGVLKVGYAAAGTRDIVPIDHCPVLDPALAGALDAAWALAECVIAEGKPLDIQATATEAGLDIDLRGSGPLPPVRLAALSRIAEAHRLARLTRHGELVLQRAAPTLTMGKARVTLPPGSFLQATAAGEEALAALVRDACRGMKSIADLFCGIGPFALRLAERARVSAFDSEPGAIRALQQAARATPGLKPVTAVVRDLFRQPLAQQELRDFDGVVFDPPRQGAEAQARQLAKSRTPAIVAVSCNPASFARDARILIDAGYRLGAVTPVDQFKYTPHVELVARFAR